MSKLVSIHGGHSGQFCNHAEDSLEKIIQTYIAKGFQWAGITEHMPPLKDSFLYPEEKKAGLNAAAMQDRFGEYIKTTRWLQQKYSSSITIYLGVETEFYSNVVPFIEKLWKKFQPDFLVGSVHHVTDIPFDYSPGLYAKALAAAGSIEALYCHYFDLQYEMLKKLRPAVVGHFDLIRIYDDEYHRRWQVPEIITRIKRNLEFIRECDLILDFNLRAFQKGDKEPYISKPILLLARDLGIKIVPGDDSHGKDQVGLNISRAIKILKAIGVTDKWPRPV